MAITGTFSYDSTTNGAGSITTNKDISSVTFEGECVHFTGTSARLTGSGSFTNCLIWINDPASATIGGSFSIQSGNITFTRSKILFNILPTSNHRTSISVGSLQDVHIGREIGGTSQRFFVYTGGDLINTIFENIYVHEVNTVWGTFSNVSYLNTELGMLNWARGRLDRFGINIPSTESGYVSWLGDSSGNQFWDWNPVNYDDTKLIIDSRYSYDSKAQYVGYTASWKFLDASNTAIENLLLVYRDDRSSIGGALAERARYVTNSSGYLTGTINSRTLSSGSDVQRETLFVLRRQSRRTSGTFTIDGYTEPPGGWNYVMDTVTHQIEVRSYLHQFPGFINNVTSQIGVINADQTVSLYRDFILLIDSGVTETNTSTVTGYSGITNATGSVTLSGTLSLSQVYDSRKLYWRNNDSVSTPTQQGEIANFGTANITISAGSNSPATTAKYQQFTTTGDITLSATGTYLNGHVPATGEVIVVAGETILEGWTFASGATISRVSGSATVFVDASQIGNITQGTGVTLLSIPYTLTLTGIVVGSRIFIFDTDNDLEIYNSVASDTSISVDINGGINLLIRVRKASSPPLYRPFSTTLTMPSTDLSITINQELDE